MRVVLLSYFAVVCSRPYATAREERCIFRVPRSSQGTANGGTVCKWGYRLHHMGVPSARCRRDVIKQNQPTSLLGKISVYLHSITLQERYFQLFSRKVLMGLLHERIFRRIFRRMSSFSNTSRSLYTSFVYAPNTLAYDLKTSHTAKPQEEF